MMTRIVFPNNYKADNNDEDYIPEYKEDNDDEDCIPE